MRVSNNSSTNDAIKKIAIWIGSKWLEDLAMSTHFFLFMSNALHKNFSLMSCNNDQKSTHKFYEDSMATKPNKEIQWLKKNKE